MRAPLPRRPPSPARAVPQGAGVAPQAPLPPAPTPARLHAQSVAVAGYVRAWLNAEWALEALDAPHAEVATAAGDAYVAARAGGGDDADVGDVLLSVAAALAGHPALGPTYTDGFEVANKVRGGGRGRRSSWRVVRSTVADPRPCLRPPPHRSPSCSCLRPRATRAAWGRTTGPDWLNGRRR